MVTLLTFLLMGIVAYATTHYTLSTFWANPLGRAVVAAVFAILCAVFLVATPFK